MPGIPLQQRHSTGTPPSGHTALPTWDLHYQDTQHCLPGISTVRTHCTACLGSPGCLSPFAEDCFLAPAFSMIANVQGEGRLATPRLSTCRPRLKRLESDEPPAKCPRLSETPPDSGLLPSPGSPQPLAPHSATPQHQGATCLANYLLLPAGDHVSRALNLHTGEELQCKVFSLKHYQKQIQPYVHLPCHPNITGIVEVIQGESKVYVFFEKDYGDMHSYVRSCKRLCEEEAAKLFRQIISAVSHCHRYSVVLGDLKLRKFVFSDKERTQLRLESLEDSHIMKGDDDALSDKHGCPAYVSPEILNTTGTYSGKSADVWSLGVMLYTLLVGRYPFHDADPSTLFSKIRRGQYCIPDHVSPKARCLIRSLLRKEPSERLSAEEILLHPWFEAASQPGYADRSNTDQLVPDIPQNCDNIDSFFC